MSERPRWTDRSLVQLTLVRYREFMREPEAVFWVFAFPVLLAAGLGLAFRSRPADRTVVAVAAGDSSSQYVAEALRRSPDVVVKLLPAADAADSLRTGGVALVVVPDHWPERQVEYRYDETRPESRLARLVVDDALQRAAGRGDPVSARDARVTEAGARYIDFVVPGLLGMNLMGSGIWSVGFAIVDARRKRLLKRLIATPMSRGEYLASFVLSRLSLLIFEVVTLLGFAVLVFGVPIRGPLTTLVTVCVLAALAFTSLGLLIASRVQTVEGVSGIANLVMLPMWIFSGVFFSASRFPDVMQPVIRVLPLTAVIDALRANILRGTGLGGIVPELLVIAAWLVLSFPLALRLFRWR
ncbi:MAG TPA: ABC transporter permease [Gemmatimonadales bacterium]|jgi:ABC-2 type transport system permease protein|nr:ABC transporter permease [Gemmatimonadales bacterium]